MRTLKAYGTVYSAGEEIGQSGYRITERDITTIMDRSPRTVPLVLDLNSHHDPDYVIGRAAIRLRDGKHIVTAIKFNENGRKLYEPLLSGNKSRDALRFGFLLLKADMDKKQKIVTDGYISCLALNETCLGGKIDRFGWEDDHGEK